MWPRAASILSIPSTGASYDVDLLALPLALLGLHFGDI